MKPLRANPRLRRCSFMKPLRRNPRFRKCRSEIEVLTPVCAAGEAGDDGY
jgi:hypothetical protein